MQSIPFSSQLSLVNNGNFTQGLAGWFGSYIRHERVAIVNPEEPQYIARFFAGLSTDFIDTVPQGINQFIDVPELFTYPSKRAVDQLNLRVISSELGLLTRGPATTFADGTIATLTNHPFRFVDGDAVVEIANGTTMILTELTDTYSGEVRSGKLRTIKDTAGTVTGYALPIRFNKPPTPILSSSQFMGVIVDTVGVSQAGTGVVKFISDVDTLLLIQHLDRGDGTTGFRIGDSLLLEDRDLVVNVTGVGAAPVPPINPTSYNLSVASVPGTVRLTPGLSIHNWSVFPSLYTSAVYNMNLYRFDYTLAYTYKTANAGPPRPAQINLYTVGEDIRGIGTLANTIPSKSELTVDVEFESTGQWRRRLEYLSKEFAVPPKGRWMLNIPPAGFAGFVAGDPLELESITYIPATNRALLEYTEYGELGDPVVSLSYNPTLRQVTVVGDLGHPFDPVAGQLMYLSGRISGTMPDWLLEPINERRGLHLSSYNANTNTAVFVLSVTSATGSLSLTGLLDSTIRLSDTRPRQAKLLYAANADWEIRLQGPNALPTAAAWAQPLFDSNSEILGSATVVSLFGFASARLRTEIAWPGPALSPPPSPAFINTDNLEIVVGLSGETDSQSAIGDIALWKGYQFYRMNSTDTADLYATALGSNVSIDPLLSRTDTTGNIIPKGTVVLYAGGGVCPTGFKPVTNTADAEPINIGLPKLQSIPWPDSLEYNEDTDTTQLIWNFLRFDQKNPDGTVILKEASVRYVNLTVPGSTYVRQITVEQAKQYIEPGMFLRTKEQVYEAGRSSLVDAANGLTDIDLYGPVADHDGAFLMTDLDLTVGSELVSGASANALLIGIFPGVTPTVRSTFGDGRGSIEYPSLEPATFIPRPTGAQPTHDVGTAYPLLPPAGPGRVKQREIFFPNTPYAYLVIDSTNPLADGGGQTQQDINCHRMESSDVPSVPFTINVTGTMGGMVNVNLQTDAFVVLNDTPGHPDRIVSSDVFFARVYLYPNAIPNITGNPDVAPLLHDSFFVKIRQPTLNRWIVNRYDARSFRLYDIGSPNYKMDPTAPAQGDINRVKRGFIVLQPASLYGKPGTRQAFRNVLPPGDSIGVSPQGTGEGFVQQKVTVDDNGTLSLKWVSSVVQVGTTITVTGDLTAFTGDQSTLLVEPSGYLRYDDPTTGIDYGASGHRHVVEDNLDLVLDDALPRVLNTRLEHYPPMRLPSEHGHGQIGNISYAMPAAQLFTLCVKL